MCLWWFVRSFRLSPSFRTQNPSREVSGALEKKTFRERRFHFALRCKNKSSVTLVYRIFTTHKDTQLLGFLFFFFGGSHVHSSGLFLVLMRLQGAIPRAKLPGEPFQLWLSALLHSITHTL